MALQTNARCIGVNCRNLDDFSIDLSLHELLREVKTDICKIAESGIDSKKYLTYVSSFADASLIGSFLDAVPRY